MLGAVLPSSETVSERKPGLFLSLRDQTKISFNTNYGQINQRTDEELPGCHLGEAGCQAQGPRHGSIRSASDANPEGLSWKLSEVRGLAGRKGKAQSDAG